MDHVYRMYRDGTMLFGQGPGRNPVEALFWYELLAVLQLKSSEQILRHRAIFAEENALTPAQVAAVERRVRDWRPSPGCR